MGRKFLVPVVFLAAIAAARGADAEKPKPPADKGLEAEVAQLRKQLALAQKRVAQLAKEKEELRDRLTAAEIEARALRDRTLNLERQLQRLSRQVAALRAGAATPAVRAAANPPKENVEGEIERVDAKGLVKVNVGSDAGLAVGHTLEVFRLGDAPKYLGRIRIVSVKAKEAVGQAVGRSTAPLQKGDRVASRITGK
jgi:hypothetical protein